MKIITLDGPAGAGKSSTAKALARELGWYHMDTGAMYRSVALAALEQNISLENEKDLAELAASLDIQSAYGDVFLNGRNITAEIRIDRVTTATRFVADAPSVREEMKKMQRSLSEEFNLVTEGRDQGTVVFPDAELKIYLDASPATRAARRYRERVDIGDQSRTMDEILHSQLQRDQGDRNRPVGAMAAALDAIIIKTDELSLENVVKQVLELACDRGLISD
ncbi:MAG TPA: (d)CMP kinase [Planctomycetaceae bacterium]|nr:(d)CMP kinase [Planctomycetaceae bacterium]